MNPFGSQGSGFATPIGSGMIRIPAARILELEKMLKTMPQIAVCRDWVMRRVHTAPLQFRNGLNLVEPTQQQSSIIQEYWEPFSKDSMDAIWLLGVVPVTWLILPTGDLVPSVLKVGTYDLGIYTSAKANRICYCVFANNLNEDPTDTIDRTCGGGLFSGTGMQSGRRQFSDFGPSALDPAENSARRADLGAQYVNRGGVDRRSVVLSGYGYDPLADGTIVSVVARLYEAVQAKLNHDRLYSRQEGRVAAARPFVVNDKLSPDVVRELISTVEPPGGLGDGTSSVEGRRRFLEAQEIADNIARVQAEQNALEQRTAVTDPLSARGGIGGSYDSNATANAMAENFNLRVAEQKAYNVAPSGCSMVNIQPTTSSKHYPYICDSLEQLICAMFGTPVDLWRPNSAARDTFEGKMRMANDIVHWWIAIQSRLLTRTYSAMFSEADSLFVYGNLLLRTLQEEAVAQLIRELDHIDGAQIRSDYHLYDRIIRWSNGSTDGKLLGKRKGDFTRTVPKLSKRDDDALTNVKSTIEITDPEGMKFLVESEDPDESRRVSDPHMSMKEVLFTPDSDLADVRVKELYKQALMKASADAVAFIMDHKNGRDNWYSKATGRVKQIVDSYDPVVGLFERAESGVQSENFITVTFASTANIEQEKLLQLRAMGIVAPDECDNAIRTSLFLPVPAKSLHKKNVLDKYSDYLGSMEFEQQIKESGIGPLLEAAKKGKETQMQQAVDQAVNKERAKFEIEKEKMRLQMQNMKDKQKQQNKPKPDSKST